MDYGDPNIQGKKRISSLHCLRVTFRPALVEPRHAKSGLGTPKSQGGERQPLPFSVIFAQWLERTVLKVAENDKYTLSSIKKSVSHFLNFNRLPFLCFSSFLSSANMSEQSPLGPFKLVTVNTAPERAKRLIGRVVKDVKDKYEIVHSANIESKYARSIRTISAYRRQPSTTLRLSSRK